MIYLRSFNNAYIINKTPEIIFEIGHDAMLNVLAMSSCISGSYACLVVLVWLRETKFKQNSVNNLFRAYLLESYESSNSLSPR